MIEIKFVGSGGQGAVVAAKILGIAISINGYQTQSFASYGYSRRGGTVESYVRISEEKIRIHTKMYEPDYLVLMGEGFTEDPKVASGLKEGGAILINSSRPLEYFSFLGKFKIFIVDADRIAFDTGLRLPSGIPIINTAIVGAVLGMISRVGIDSISEAIKEGGIPFPEKNAEAAKIAYSSVTSPELRGGIARVAEEAPVEYEEQLPAYQTKIPPCEAHCPACEPTLKSSFHIKNNEFEEALEVIKSENPFPGICGRVCFQPCEIHCSRNEFDDGVAISALERAAFDYADINKVKKPEKKAETGKMVAIIGSGPAGMTCAYFLSLLGHHVTVFEALPVLGGIPRVGIPAYRLPNRIVDREISEIIDLGIKVRTETEIGKDLPFEETVEKYNACFIASGAHRPIKLNIQGEDTYGVIFGLNFLKDIAFGREVDLGRRVAVIGGGNTAVDAARTAKRLGAKDVIIIYRRSIEEMPAYRKEVEAVEREGVSILYLTMPVQIHGNGERVDNIECMRTRLGKKEYDGRPRPEPVEGSNFIIEADTIIAALGESVNGRFLPSDIEMDDGLIKVDRLGRTSKAGIYAGGDLTTFSRSVVESIASGKRAALGIDSYLWGTDGRTADALVREKDGAVSMRAYMAGEYSGANSEVASFNNLNLSYFPKLPRNRGDEAPAGKRSSNFEEVNSGLTRDKARAESERCFHCGQCNQCGNCYSFCPDVAVTFDAEANSFSLHPEFCKRCGICIEECPHNAIAWKGGGK